VGAYEAALTSLWVYFVALSDEIGYPKTIVTLAVDICIAFQILGGLSAALVGRRITYRPVLSICPLLALACIIALSADIGPVPFLVVAAAFGLVWRFAVAYQVEFIIAADPSRRAAMFTMSAQSTGIAIGPFLSSFVVSENSVQHSLAVSGCLFLLSLMLLAIVQKFIARNLPARPRVQRSGAD
jgi:MFS family permease